MAEHKGGLAPEAYEEIPGDQYPTYVASDTIIPEFSWKGVILGSIFGIAFGAANAYLGLRVGLTISTSIPIAVMTVTVFALLKPLLGKATILESNMSQTVGSASSSLASGIIFTVPALFMWGILSPDSLSFMHLLQIGSLAAIGGCLGILFMVPLRRFLISEEHGKLPYPEGTAAAEVLVAAEEGGTSAKNVFTGMSIAIVYSFFWKGLKLWVDKIAWDVPFIRKAQVSFEPSPALLGVGYILGFRIATIMVLGAALSALVLSPVIAGFWGNQEVLITSDGTTQTKLIRDLSFGEMRNTFIRFIGAGAVAAAGIITLIKSIPTMAKSFKLGMQKLRQGKAGVEEGRTKSDLSLKTVGFGALIVVVVLAITPFLFYEVSNDLLGFFTRIGLGLLVVIFAFFFVTVSARIVGLVGVTSNPTSGMIIGTLICLSLLFLLFGWTDESGKATVIVMGTMVGVAASIAGDTSQDLKTGFLLGATPRKQQIGEIIGVVATAFFVAGSVFLLAKNYEFGVELEAPQAKMMQLLVDSILSQQVPWVLVGTGVAITLIIWALRLPTLAFAVGVYLSLATMFPIFVGGLIRLIVEKRSASDEGLKQKRRESGILFGSGLVGGEGLMGVGIAAYAFFLGKPGGIIPHFSEVMSLPDYIDLIPLNLLPFGILVYLLWKAIHTSDKKLKA